MKSNRSYGIKDLELLVQLLADPGALLSPDVNTWAFWEEFATYLGHERPQLYYSFLCIYIFMHTKDDYEHQLLRVA